MADRVSSCRRSVAAFAWGDDIVFSPASIAATKEEAKDLQLVTVNVGTEISKGYIKGGQFLQMKVGDSKAAFLAIANAPAASEDGMMEFLIKDVPETTASMIVKLAKGDEVCAPSLCLPKTRHLANRAAAHHAVWLNYVYASGLHLRLVCCGLRVHRAVRRTWNRLSRWAFLMYICTKRDIGYMKTALAEILTCVVDRTVGVLGWQVRCHSKWIVGSRPLSGVTTTCPRVSDLEMGSKRAQTACISVSCWLE